MNYFIPLKLKISDLMKYIYTRLPGYFAILYGIKQKNTQFIKNQNELETKTIEIFLFTLDKTVKIKYTNFILITCDYA